MKAGDFDQQFVDAVDISAWLDLSKARRVDRERLWSQKHASFIEIYNQGLHQDSLPLDEYRSF